MLSCPRCAGTGRVRPSGAVAPYVKVQCPLCWDPRERCSTGLVEARIAREWRDSRPNQPNPVRDSAETLVGCPACESCPHCRGTHLVTPLKAAEVRGAPKP